ncbi:MAG TPA: hypothetical protein VK463_07900 [Desulfomonilaceae bacterium]|nr:hypothetical protein [Desulfomonilaceae bacterium]
MGFQFTRHQESCDEWEPSFTRLHVSRDVPEHLRDGAPEILWLPPHADISPPIECLKPAITCTRIDDTRDREVCLVSTDGYGRGHAHFPLGQTIDGILLEAYREQLQAPLAAKLPFNYSLVPNWVKNAGKVLTKSHMARKPDIDFPGGDPAFVVEWLSELAAWCGINTKQGRPFFDWPDEYKAALCVSHDVDTDWLFRHPDWIERMCDMEEEHGVTGVWFCVPYYCRSRTAEKGIQRLLDRGCEIACHGYNHDAKLTFLDGRARDARFREIEKFVHQWRIRGFRSEWLLRTPSYLEKLSELFEYDSSVPNVSSCFTSRTRNGCATCHVYKTHNGMLELPLTVPQDVERDLEGSTYREFWSQQVVRARRIVSKGGLVMLSLHPQGHQSANRDALDAFGLCLKEVTKIKGLWVTRPDRICDWLKSTEQNVSRETPLPDLARETNIPDSCTSPACGGIFP